MAKNTIWVLVGVVVIVGIAVFVFLNQGGVQNSSTDLDSGNLDSRENSANSENKKNFDPVSGVTIKDCGEINISTSEEKAAETVACMDGALDSCSGAKYTYEVAGTKLNYELYKNSDNECVIKHNWRSQNEFRPIRCKFSTDFAATYKAYAQSMMQQSGESGEAKGIIFAMSTLMQTPGEISFPLQNKMWNIYCEE